MTHLTNIDKLIQRLGDVPRCVSPTRVLHLWSIYRVEQLVRDLSSEELVELFRSGYKFSDWDLQVWIAQASREDYKQFQDIVNDHYGNVLGWYDQVLPDLV